MVFGLLLWCMSFCFWAGCEVFGGSAVRKQGVNIKTSAQDENPGRLGRCNGYPIWVYIPELRYESKSLVKPLLGSLS